MVHVPGDISFLNLDSSNAYLSRESLSSKIDSGNFALTEQD